MTQANQGESAQLRISAKQLQTVTSKLKRTKNAERLLDYIESAGGDERGALLWHLVRTGVVDASHDSRLWAALNEHDEHASSQDVYDFLKTVDPQAATSPLLLVGWPLVIDQMVMPAYVKDPGPWERGYRALPAVFHPGVALVRARGGALGPDQMPVETLRAVAAQRAAGSLSYIPWIWTQVDGQLEALEIFDGMYQPTDGYDQLVALLGSRESWLQSLYDAALALSRLRVGNIMELAAWADRQQTAELLSRGCDSTFVHAGTVLPFLAAGDHDADDLAWIAANLRERWREAPYHSHLKEIAESCTVASILQQPRGSIPLAVDQHLHFSGLDQPYFHGLADYVAALRHLPVERCRNLLQRQLASSQPALAIAALSALPEPALVEAALGLPVSRDPYSGAPAWARLGAAQLPTLARAHDDPKHAKVQETLARAIVMILGVEAIAGRTWDPAFDRFVHFRFNSKDDMDFVLKLQDSVNAALAGLSAERRAAVLTRELSIENAYFTRIFESLDHASDEVLKCAFLVLASRRDEIKQPYRPFILHGLARLGWERVASHVCAALLASDHDRGLIDHLCGAFRIGPEELLRRVDATVNA